MADFAMQGRELHMLMSRDARLLHRGLLRAGGCFSAHSQNLRRCSAPVSSVVWSAINRIDSATISLRVRLSASLQQLLVRGGKGIL